VRNLSEADVFLLDSGRKAAARFKEDGLPLRLMQKRLSAHQRYLMRTDPEILHSIFALHPADLSLDEDNYYFWDSTTLSLFDAAQAFLDRHLVVNPQPNLLDLGCGPYAILGCALKKLYPALNTVAADVSASRTQSAKKFSVLNQLNISTISSDLLASCFDEYDLILFNPPYVQPGSHQHSSLGLSAEEAVSGISREPTIKLISRLVNQFLELPGNPTLMLGINNYFLPHKSILKMLKSDHVSISTLYPESITTPYGAFCQVYSVKKSF